MNIDIVFSEFAEKIAQINLRQSEIIDNFNDKIEKINRRSAEYTKHIGHNNTFDSFHNMFFHEAKTGKLTTFSQKNINLNEKIGIAIEYKNKQYQWLLAEAYEHFEDFLDATYAIAGYADKSLWPLNDYGNVYLDQPNEKPLEWFIKQTSIKKSKPHSILNQLRAKFKEIGNIEANNALKIDLRLTTTTIEHLRHAIVHNSGTVKNKKDFIEKILNKSELNKNNKPSQDHLDFINYFFGKDKWENTINLLEDVKDTTDDLFTYRDVLSNTINYLVTHAHLIHTEIKNKENQ